MKFECGTRGGTGVVGNAVWGRGMHGSGAYRSETGDEAERGRTFRTIVERGEDGGEK